MLALCVGVGVTVCTVVRLIWYWVTCSGPRPPPAGAGTGGAINPDNKAAPAPPVVAAQKPVPNMFAVVIGISNYASPDVPNLHGCARDADDILDFLMSTLSAPLANITNLRNSQATRAAIENAIATLGNDPRIKQNDPILIFYAGHGGEATCPPEWPGNGKVQMLIPYDFIPQTTNSKRGQGVLDIRLSHLLRDIADKKGNNITVIFDSCYSGSGTRDDESDSSLTRGIELHPTEYQVAEDILDDLPGDRASIIAKGYEKSGLLSHVLLSACSKGQKAKEIGGRGLFTQGLTKLWRGEGVDMLTYADAIALLPDLSAQNPQCEGVNQSRVLFNSSLTNEHQMYRVTCEEPGAYILKAGDHHGVAPEAQFTIYSDRKLRNPLGNVVALEPTAFQTTLGLAPEQETFSFSGDAYAIQTRAGRGNSIKFHIPADRQFSPIIAYIEEEMQKNVADICGISLVDSDAFKPELTISATIENGKTVAAFNINDPTCTKYGFTQMPYTSNLNPKVLYPILRSAADFYWNLNRSPNESIITPKINFSAYKLVESGEYNDDFEAVLLPDKQMGDLNVEGTITVYVDDERDYGFSIKNLSATPLFVGLFYFDMSDLSISTYYQPGFAKDGQVDASIPAGGELTIGYGDSGTVPYNYILRPNQAIDIGYLKLFFSTAYVDLSSIEQTTPFNQERASTRNRPKTKLIQWDTMKIVVVQKTRTPM